MSDLAMGRHLTIPILPRFRMPTIHFQFRLIAPVALVRGLSTPRWGRMDRPHFAWEYCRPIRNPISEVWLPLK
jgi:hypothetical protein